MVPSSGLKNLPVIFEAKRDWNIWLRLRMILIKRGVVHQNRRPKVIPKQKRLWMEKRRLETFLRVPIW